MFQSHRSAESQAATAATEFENDIIQILELLEVSIHAILYTRQIYSAESFIRCKKYGVPVFKCTEPAIIEYISGALKTVGEEIIEGNAIAATMTLHDERAALERYIFTFEYHTMEDTNAPADSAIASSPAPADDSVTFGRSSSVQHQLQSTLLNLNEVHAQLLPLPDSDVTFSFVVKLKEDLAAGTANDADAIVYDPSASVSQYQRPRREQDISSDLPIIQELFPIHVIQSRNINISLFVQESVGKKSRRCFRDQDDNDDDGDGSDEKRHPEEMEGKNIVVEHDESAKHILDTGLLNEKNADVDVGVEQDHQELDADDNDTLSKIRKERSPEV